MPLAAGTRLGAYEIVAPLGAGGMGDVYRAMDLKLGTMQLVEGQTVDRLIPQGADPDVRDLLDDTRAAVNSARGMARPETGCR